MWRAFLPAFDYIILLGALVVCSFIWLDESPVSSLRWEKFLSTTAYIISILLTIVVTDGYQPKEYFRRLGFAAEFVLSTYVGSAIGLFVIFALFPGSLRSTQESRAVLLLGSTAFLIPALAARYFLARIRAIVAEHRPFLVIGSQVEMMKFSENFAGTGLPNPLVFLDPTNQATANELPDSIWESFDGIILTESITDLSAEFQSWLLEVHSENLPVYTQRCFYASMWRQSPILDGSPDWVFDQDFRLAERSYYRIIKRVLDLFFASLLLILTLPLLIITAVLIKLDSPGPILFHQERVGRQKAVFQLLKFRTMHVREDAGPLYTAKCDPRVTRIGSILRRLRIDELPQLINIWRGEMSLVGPRPEWNTLVQTYEREIPGYHLRHLVSPGITGWAQLNHDYGESVEDAIQKLKFDLYYIQFYSPVLDLEIALKTIVSILLAKGR